MEVRSVRRHRQRHPDHGHATCCSPAAAKGYFYALDARTGALLWKASLGGQIVNGPITYAVDGKQYVSVISGNSLVTFALRN